MVLGSDPLTSETLVTRSGLLASLSPVFGAMLEAPLAEARDKTVRIQDVDPRSFEIVLTTKTSRLAATHQINSVSTAVGILHICSKYLITDAALEEASLQYVLGNISPDNVLYILQHLSLLNNHQNTFSCHQHQHTCDALVRECFNVLDRKASNILRSDSFEEISLDLLRQIVARDSLVLGSELEVFSGLNRWAVEEAGLYCTALYCAVLYCTILYCTVLYCTVLHCNVLYRWAHRQCRRRGLVPSDANKRGQLRGCQYQVRSGDHLI